MGLAAIASASDTSSERPILGHHLKFRTANITGHFRPQEMDVMESRMSRRETSWLLVCNTSKKTSNSSTVYP